MSSVKLIRWVRTMPGYADHSSKIFCTCTCGVSETNFLVLTLCDGIGKTVIILDIEDRPSPKMKPSKN